MYQRPNDRLLQCGIFHWLSALMNLWSHTMVGAAQRFHKGKADSHGLQGLDALCERVVTRLMASNCWQTYSRLHTMNQQVAFQRKDVKHTHLIQAYNSGMGDTYCCSTSY
ncbi:hypothetical protein T08_4147 [Trichinella sp. T8]|nr:hypothetical protein T08_4147 [Trichinella sp. T8]